jgi:hypothetical protein
LPEFNLKPVSLPSLKFGAMLINDNSPFGLLEISFKAKIYQQGDQVTSSALLKDVA